MQQSRVIGMYGDLFPWLNNFNSFCQLTLHGYFCRGEMAERSNAAVLKTVDSKGPGVRIPLSPPLTHWCLSTSGFLIL